MQTPPERKEDGDEDEGKDEDGDEDDKAVPQFLTLTFHFKYKQDEDQLKMLADHLKKFMKLDNTSLQKICWDSLSSGKSQPLSSRWREAVSRVMASSKMGNSTFAPSNFQSDLLLQRVGRDSPQSSAESTPQLSDTSSDVLDEEATTRSSTYSSVSAVDTLRDLGRSSIAREKREPYDFKWWFGMVAGKHPRYGQITG